MLMRTPVPRSKPAVVTSLGQMFTCQWKAPLYWCGAVRNTRLYDTSPTAACRWRMASRMATPTAATVRSSLSVRCRSWLRGMIINSNGDPLQNGQMQMTSSLANTTRFESTSSASTVAHKMHPPSKRLNPRCSSSTSPGTKGRPSNCPCGCANDAPASRPWLMMAWVKRRLVADACSRKRRCNMRMRSAASRSLSVSRPPL